MILFITREQEIGYYRHIVKKLNAEVIQCPKVKRPWWFTLAYNWEEYELYQHLPQSPYWKNRIYIHGSYWLRWRIFKIGKLFYRPPQEIIDKLKELKPEAVCCTNIAYYPTHSDYDYAHAARLLGIPVIGFVLTLDNLTTKSPFHLIPDLVFCWNELHKGELVKYHHIPEDRIIQVGPFKFEDWMHELPTVSRKEFCRKYNLDPKKKIHTYFCSSPNIVPNEEPDIEEWEVEHKEDQTLVKTHPQRPLPYEPIEDKPSLYRHSDCLYAINSSCMIEALLMGKEVKIILKEKYRETQQDCMHFQFFNSLTLENYREKLGMQSRLPSELIAQKLSQWLKPR